MNLPIRALPSGRLSAGRESRQSRRDRRCFRWRSILTPLPLVFAIMTGDLSAQTQPAANTTDQLKALSLEELGNLVVTSPSGRPEELSTVASAIQVITQDDIRRSGATRLPEVLRLATNLEVAQLDSSQWAISARGFNSPLANKLLVLIDGRTVYSPLFAGVFWDAQDVLLEDIDRIEIISGPGATLWGANAVNGVINITTKSARETHGLFLEGGGGTELQGFGIVRYGVPLTPDASFRIYGKSAARDSMELGSGVDAANAWRIRQGGFRLDWDRSDADRFTLQGDLYQDYNVSPKPSDPRTSGGNVIGRWSRTFSPASDLALQLYADRVHKISPGSYDDVLATYDVDFQHRLPTVHRHAVVWGASYRLVKDDFGPGTIAFVPRRLTQHTFSAFAQDEIALAPDRLVLTLGSKIQRDAYTGLELQPSVRLAWTSSARHTLWTSISRAVRTPSRLDRDFIVLPLSIGGPDFESEELLAYEVGYRARLHERLFVAISSYYNDYDKIRSTEQAQPPAPIPQMFANRQEGESYGVELMADYRHTDWWRIQMGYTEVQVQIRPKPTSTDATRGRSEAADSPHRFYLRSSLDLPGRLELNPAFRAVSRIKNPVDPVGAYAELDIRLAWQMRPRIQLSLVGQNLLHDHHLEFGLPLTGQKIQRSVYGKATYRW